jgi:hypothetical protein
VSCPGLGDLVAVVAEGAHRDARHEQLAPDAATASEASVVRRSCR